MLIMVLREGLVDLEIGVQSNMGPEIRLQRLFEDRFVGVVRKGHPLANQAEIGVKDYVAWGHVVASPEGALHGSVDDALAELGTKRKIASVVPGFPTALSVALASDLIAMIPALYLLNQQVTEQLHVFELLFKSRRITVSQMWHPRMERDPGHRWLREQILAICGVERSDIISGSV
ncbi:Symbiotic regulator-like protein [Enterobacter intestinihominis]